MIGLALLAAALCGPPQDHTLASAHATRIYSHGATVYGCVRRHDPVRLGANDRLRAQLDHFAIAGAHVAFQRSSHGVDTSSASVVLVDLRAGHRLAVLPAATPLGRPESFQSVTALALGGPGAMSVAWIASSSAIGMPAALYEVRLGRRVLDSGADVDPHSLVLRGRTVSWRRDGQPRSAKLTR